MMQEKESKYKDKFVLGVDFGETTTGIALGKNGVVAPAREVLSKDRMTAIQHILRTVKQNKVVAVVVGLPLGYDQKDTPQSLEVRRFAKLLKTRLGIPIILIDEFGTSQEALADAIIEELPQKARRKVDSISASIILKRFFADEGF